MYNKGLAYRAKVLANWCPKDKTVLANEQVINGKCERCGTQVEQKSIEQWLFKITDYADELVDGLTNLDWPDAAKLAQENWIGRSEGAELVFNIKDSKVVPIRVFTTRPDTVYGATYLVFAPEHPLIDELAKDIKNFKEIKDYAKEARNKPELERTSSKEKTGVRINGLHGINPATGEEVPIYVADYVLRGYGTCAIMAVPAHDQRDYDFAKKFGLPVRQVILPPNGNTSELPYTGEGTLINSGLFNGYQSKRAAREIVLHLKKEKMAMFKTAYKLRDWLVSRQRYWGAPIPMINCPSCGYQPVPEDELPVELPKLKNYKPSKDGRSPLAKAEEWMKARCPKCGKDAERETDTMDTFVDSSWYFFRYADPKNEREFASREKLNAWLPVNVYAGGAEHNTMHLLYSRFITKALFDMKHVSCRVPFTRRINHGVIFGPDRQKMSKSRGNVVDPDKVVKEYGADAVRMFFAFMGPYEQGGAFTMTGINGVHRFLNKVWNLAQKEFGEADPQVGRALNRTIKKVAEDIEKFKFNTAVSEFMKLLNEMENKTISRSQLESFIKILAPFAPYMTEEIWIEILRNKKSVHLQVWPEYDPSLIEEDIVQMIVQINGKTRAVFSIAKDSEEGVVKSEALGLEAVKKHISGERVRKVIFFRNKFINFVA